MYVLKRIILTTILLSSGFYLSGQTNSLVGVYWTGSEERFASVDLPSKTFTDISSLPGITIINSGSTFDILNKRYAIGTNLGITIIDASTGVILDTIANTLLLYEREFYPATNSLVGVYWTGTEERFASLNLTSKTFTDINSLPGIVTINGDGCFDIVNNRYAIKSNLGITIIDASTGVILDTIANPFGLSGLEFYPATNSLVGVYWTGTEERFASLDISSKTFTDISSLPGVTTLWDGSTFDIYNNQYAVLTNLGITIIDASTGVILDTISLAFYLAQEFSASCPPSFGNASYTACDSYTVPSGDETYSSSGVYQDTLTDPLGCDSIITLNITINNSTGSTIWESACDTYTVPSGNETYTVSGIYKDTVLNSLGCDSIVTINLALNNTTTKLISVTACDTYTVPSGDETYVSNGSYLDTLPNTMGCDSVITINLTIINSSSDLLTLNACQMYTVPSGDETYFTSGSYSDTLPNTAGCDSLITVDLTVIPNSASTLNISVCEAYTSPSGANTYVSSGTFIDTIPNTAGCDSIITINLQVNNSSSSGNVSTCDSYTVPSGDETYYLSGIYSDTVANSSGCDSLLTINLTIKSSTSSTIGVSACGFYTVPSANETYFVSGTYMDTLVNVDACDSLLTINLVINLLPTIFAGEDLTIFSGEEVQLVGFGGLFYNWSPDIGLSCTNCQSPIASPESNTEYILTVSDSLGCVNSDTINIYVDHTSSLYVPDIFSPNGDGENDWLFIQGKGIVEVQNFIIYDRWGHKVFDGKNRDANDFSVGWNGTFKGKKLNSGVFVYDVTVLFTNGSVASEQGNITLVR